MESKGTVVLKKRGGLGKLHGLMRGAPAEYYQDKEDRNEEGQYAGSYKSPSLPGIRHYISPKYSEMDGKWCFSGTDEDLERIVGELELRHASGKNEDEVIKYKDIRLNNPKDKFFTHNSLYNQRWLEDGRYMLNLNNPLDEFFYFVYSGWRECHDKTNPNEAFDKMAKYELENPKVVKSKQARNVRQEIQANLVFSDLTKDGDFEKLRMIAEIMDLPSFSELRSSDDDIYVMVKEQAVDNLEKDKRFGDKTFRERFLELAKLPDEELYVTHRVAKAKRLRILVSRGSYFQFNTGNSGLSDRLDGIVTDNQLMNYFLNPDHDRELAELDNQLEQRKSKAQK